MLPINDDNTELAVFQTDGSDNAMDDPTTAPPLLRSRTPDLTISPADVDRVSLTERLGERKDDGMIQLWNDDGQYTDLVTSGDRIEVRVEYAIPDVTAWGDDAWGDKTWDGQRLEWTCWVRDRDFERSGTTQRLDLECEDFVFGLMTERDVDQSFDQQMIPGALSQLLDANAQELRLSADRSLTDDIEATFSGTPLIDAANHLFAHGELSTRAYSDMLVVGAFGSETSQFTVGSDEHGTLSVTEGDGSLTNYSRVDGGTDEALDRESTLQGQDGYFYVNESSPIWQFRVPTRKSEIARIALWVYPNSEEDLTVRLQKAADDGRDPIAPFDEEADLARRRLSREFLADDGWTEFIMPDHTLPEPYPYVLIESQGEGHRLGVNDDGLVVRKVWYPYNVVAAHEDPTSVENYRRRDSRVVDDSIETYEEARDRAIETVTHNNQPELVVQTRADSLRMHMLRPGEVVSFDVPDEGVTGNYIVTERTASFDGVHLETDLSFQESASV